LAKFYERLIGLKVDCLCLRQPRGIEGSTPGFVSQGCRCCLFTCLATNRLSLVIEQIQLFK
jgi:hypothetical protein